MTSGKEHFVVNVASNLAFTLVQAAVALWYTPYLIRHLGLGAYGIVALTSSIIAYMSLVTQGFNTAVSRFLTIDLARRDHQTANRTFNTALFGLTGVVGAMVPFVLILAVVFPYIFHVPAGSELDATGLFVFVATTFLISVIAGTFTVSAYARNKFVLMNVLNFIVLFTRIAIIVSLLSLFPPHLWYVGLGFLVAACVGASGGVLLWRKLTPELTIQPKYFDRSRFRSLMGMGGWSSVQQVGTFLSNNTDLMIVNLAFTAEITGAYGSLLQFPTMINVMAMSGLTVINRAIVKKYAEADFGGMKRLACQTIKLCGWMISIPVGLLCGFSAPFLSIWLGPSFQQYHVLLVMLVFELGLNLSMLPLGFVQTSYNKLRWPGIVTLATGLADLGLVIAVASWGGWGALGVAFVSASMWTLRNAVFMPLYTARIMKLRWWTFLPSLSAAVMGTAFVGVVAYAAARLWNPTDWFGLVLSVFIVTMLCGVCIARWGLNRDDWRLISDLLPRPLGAKLTRLLKRTVRV